jgi:dephospho-CoA kinase
LVTTKPEIAIERIMLRDNCTEKKAIDILNSQFPDYKKKIYANFIIDNSSNLNYIEDQVLSVWNIIQD